MGHKSRSNQAALKVSALRINETNLAGKSKLPHLPEFEGVEATVSTNATHDHTHKNGPGENLTDGNPRLEEASNKELFSMVRRLVSLLDEERIASKDRETRLNQKINELSAQVQSLTKRLTDLGKEAQAREEKFTRRVNDVKSCVMSVYANNVPSRTKAHSPTPDTLTAHADPNAYTVTEVATYSEATQSNPERQQRRSGADPLTDRVTEQKRPTTSVSTHEQSKNIRPTRKPTLAGELNSLRGIGMMKMKMISSGLSSLAKSRQAKRASSTLAT